MALRTTAATIAAAVATTVATAARATATAARAAIITAATTAAVATERGRGLVLATHQSETNHCEKDRNTKQNNAVHPRILQKDLLVP